MTPFEGYKKIHRSFTFVLSTSPDSKTDEHQERRLSPSRRFPFWNYISLS